MELVDNIVLFSDVVYTLLYNHLVDDSVIYILFFRLVYIIDYYRSLNTGPCVMQ